MKDYKLYINGEFVEGNSGAYIEVENPATKEVFARVPDGNEVDVDKAVAAARAALPGVRSRLKKELITWRNSPTI